MTGKHTSAFAHAGGLPAAAQVFEQTEQQLFILQHELQLLADLASTGRDGAGNLLSLETLGVVLAAYAERLAVLRAMLEAGGRS